MKFVWTQNRSKSGTRYFSEIVFHFLRFSGTAGKQRIPLCTPHDSDSSTSSDCSSVPLWPEGSTLFLSFFSSGLFIFPQLLVGVSWGAAEHRKGDLQGDFMESVLPVTKALDRASSWLTTHWGLADWHMGKQRLLGSSRGNLNLPLALRTTDLQTQSECMAIIQLRFLKELLLVSTVSVSFPEEQFTKVNSFILNSCRTLAELRCSNVDSLSNKQPRYHPMTQSRM